MLPQASRKYITSPLDLTYPKVVHCHRFPFALFMSNNCAKIDRHGKAGKLYTLSWLMIITASIPLKSVKFWSPIVSLEPHAAWYSLKFFLTYLFPRVWTNVEPGRSSQSLWSSSCKTHVFVQQYVEWWETELLCILRQCLKWDFSLQNLIHGSKGRLITWLHLHAPDSSHPLLHIHRCLFHCKMMYLKV